jgi:4'-phosphopantetheinyl transferase
MPLAKLENINQNSSWALWEIKETLEWFLDQLQLNEIEIEELQSIANPKRKLEWLAGRAALKSLLQHKGITYFNILKDEFGKPFVQNLPIYISLSHCLPYATAIVHMQHPVGIDIEEVQEKLIPISKRFLNPEELNFAKNHTEKLCIFWAAKEAMYKIYGKKKLSLCDQIRILPPFLKHDFTLIGKIITAEHTENHLLKVIKLPQHIIVHNLCE